MNTQKTLSAEARRKTILSTVLAVICVIYVLPVVAVVINSFKLNTFVKTDTFALPTGEKNAGFETFIKGEGVGLDEGVQLEGVDEHRHHGQHVDDADDA